MHLPVLVNEVVRLLLSNNGSTYVDCTFGYGGHSKALMAATERRLEICGIDWDPKILNESKQKFAKYENVALFNAPFDRIDSVLTDWGHGEVDGFLFDVGLCSLHLDDPERGFSYRFNSPLDLRYDQRKLETAEALFNNYDEREIADIIFRLGEERMAKRIAKEIVRRRPISTTFELNECVRRVCSANHIDRTLARVYQGVRCHLNGEIEQIENALSIAWQWLKTNGIIVFLAYDSIPDRLMKSFSRSRTDGCKCPPNLPICGCGFVPDGKILTKKPIVASESEIKQNPRSRSAKLRSVQKLR